MERDDAAARVLISRTAKILDGVDCEYAASPERKCLASDRAELMQLTTADGRNTAHDIAAHFERINLRDP
eukprot:SAG11_NODE_22150_length_411_cov_0.817308_1_plen_69_part_01